MTNIDSISKATKRSFGLNLNSQVRIAIPAFSCRPRVERKEISDGRLERDDLTELLQTELCELETLKSAKMRKRENVFQLQLFRLATRAHLERVA
jgi:hypothetical protein